MILLIGVLLVLFVYICYYISNLVHQQPGDQMRNNREPKLSGGEVTFVTQIFFGALFIAICCVAASGVGIVDHTGAPVTPDYAALWAALGLTVAGGVGAATAYAVLKRDAIKQAGLPDREYYTLAERTEQFPDCYKAFRRAVTAADAEAPLVKLGAMAERQRDALHDLFDAAGDVEQRSKAELVSKSARQSAHAFITAHAASAAREYLEAIEDGRIFADAAIETATVEPSGLSM